MSLDIEKLKQNNNELKEIINNSWDGIGIINNQCQFIYVNQAFSPILGYSKKELLNTTFTDLILHPYKVRFENLLKKNINNKYQSQTQVVCQRKDQQKVYLQITVSLMLNKKLFVINIKDITKQISDDEILDRYVLSCHTNCDGFINQVSQAYCNLTGYSQEELIGTHYSFIRHPDNDPKLYDTMFSTLNKGESFSTTLKKVKKDSSFFWVNVQMKPIYNKYGDITGYTSLMFDITTEKILNDDKQNLQSQMSEANHELTIQKSKLDIMRETLQMVSHEWRQPLNIISIQAQSLELDYSLNNNLDKEKLFQTLESIKHTADQLSSTIKTFQDVSEPKNEKKEIDIVKTIHHTIKQFQKKYPISDITFDVQTQQTPSFKTYETELETILTNIILNAQEAIQRNSISKGHIKISQFYEQNQIKLTIQDNAGGIKHEFMDKIFEPYYSTKESKHGVGLGLYLCKALIELHFQGTITVKNETSGAVFSILLPIIKENM